MQAPRFWYQPKGLRSKLFAPLGALYAAGTARKLAQGARENVGVPVICIGNLTAGGTGKTPTVIAVLMMLAARGVTAHVVSRGYGGSLEGPVQVKEREHKADQVGDEPLLLAAFAPTWVAKNRAEGARAAVAAGAEVILLDDGFQNASLAYDLSLVVVDATRGFGNGAVIPAGPLREPVEAGLARADLVISIGPAPAQRSFVGQWGAALNVPLVSGVLRPLETGIAFSGMRVLAFAGIGHPAKFFATLKALGAEVVRGEALSDHQPLSDALMARLTREAKLLGAQLVTTEKDAVRLPDALRREVLTVPVRLEIAHPDALDAALDQVLKT